MRSSLEPEEEFDVQQPWCQPVGHGESGVGKIFDEHV
jgi:hypothetical protein